MKKKFSRRSLFKNTAILTVATAMGTDSGGHGVLAQTPPERMGGPKLKLSCNAYSFNRLFRSGEWTLDDCFEFCAGLGFDAVDPTGYYFQGYPEVPDDEYVYRIKRKAFVLGLDISGTGVRNDFTVADASRRQADVEHIKRWIEVAAKLGAPVLRVFSGKTMPEGHTVDEVRAWVVEGFRECAEYGKRFGVVAAVQNHADFIQTAEETKRILKEVDSPWFGLVLDIAGYLTEDPYEDVAEMAPFAVSWQIKEHMKIGGKEVRTDLRKIIQIIRDAGYRGYLPLETLGEGDPREKVPRFLEEVRAALT